MSKENSKDVKSTEPKKNGLFETFGEFDSVEELNAAAAGQKAEGDRESFFLLARENGIDEVAAEAYWDGESEEFADYFSAAIGKLEIEKVVLKNQNVPVDPIVDFLSSSCMDEDFARKVRNKEKSLENCIRYTEKKCMEECQRLKPNQSGMVPFQVADMTVFQWSKEYYLLGGGKR